MSSRRPREVINQDPNAQDIIRLIHRFSAVVDAFPTNLMKTLGDLKELDAVLNVGLSDLTHKLHDFEVLLDEYETDRVRKLHQGSGSSTSTSHSNGANHRSARDVTAVDLKVEGQSIAPEEEGRKEVNNDGRDKLQHSAQSPQLQRLLALKMLADTVRKVRATADERGVVAMRGVEVVRSQTHSLDVISTMLTALLPPAILPKLPAPSTPKGYPRLFGPYKSYSHNAVQLKLPSAVGTEGFPLNMGELNNEVYNLPLSVTTPALPPPVLVPPPTKTLTVKNGPPPSGSGTGSRGGTSRKPSNGTKRGGGNHANSSNTGGSSRNANAANGNAAYSPPNSAHMATAPSRRGGRSTRMSSLTLGETTPPAIAPKGSTQPHRSSNLNPNSERNQSVNANQGDGWGYSANGKEESRKRRARSPVASLDGGEEESSNKRKKKNLAASSAPSMDVPEFPMNVEYIPPSGLNTTHSNTNSITIPYTPTTLPTPQSLHPAAGAWRPGSPQSSALQTYSGSGAEWTHPASPSQWRNVQLPNPNVGTTNTLAMPMTLSSGNNNLNTSVYPSHPSPNPGPRGQVDEEGEKKEWCFCEGRGAGEGDEMVGCDNEKDCDIEWYHLSCLGLKVVPQGNWICPECLRRGVGKKTAGNGRRKHASRERNGLINNHVGHPNED